MWSRKSIIYAELAVPHSELVMKANVAIILLVMSAMFLSFVSVRPTLAAGVVGVDLAHGEGEKYLSLITGNITDVTWKKVLDPLSDKVLADLDMLLIGQPSQPFGAGELQALKTWFNKGGKGLWVAADSDFGPGVNYINTANVILETLGSKLRVDQASVEMRPAPGPMKAPYRVLGNVVPDPGVEAVKKDITQGVLYHGPGVLAYVKPDGRWESLAASKPDNVYRIVRVEGGEIVENTAPAALAHKAGEKGSWVLLAAEKMSVAGRTNIVIASSESPYGDYEPTWASSYYGAPLDGPRFVTNLVTWTLQEVTAPPSGLDVATISIIVVVAVVAAAVGFFVLRKR